MVKLKIYIKKLLKLFVLILLVVFINSCTHSVDISAINNEICFEKQVMPIFASNCSISGCHTGTGNTTGEQLMPLNDYNSILQSIVPSDLNNSQSFMAITAQNFNSIMPPSPYSPLNVSQRTIIEIWILQGAKNTTCN